MIKFLLHLGFKNIWRNPRRSLLTAFVVAIGVISLVFIDAFILGINKAIITTQTNMWMGHTQIHHPKYLDDHKGKFESV